MAKISAKISGSGIDKKFYVNCPECEGILVATRVIGTGMMWVCGKCGYRTRKRRTIQIEKDGKQVEDQIPEGVVGQLEKRPNEVQ